MKRKMGVFARNLRLQNWVFADKTPSRLSRGELIDRQINVLAEKTQAEIGRGM
jgi:hypothetical protein